MRNSTKRRPARIGRLLLGAAVLLVAMLASTSSASAALWSVQTSWGPQNLVPGGTGEFYVTVRNKGFESTENLPYTLTVELPPGVTRIPPTPADPVGTPEDPVGTEGEGWKCTGTATVVCENSKLVDSVFTNRVLSSGAGPYVFIRVAVDAGASGPQTVTTRLEGGGPFSNVAEDVDQVNFSTQPAGFGFSPGSFKADAYGNNPFGGLQPRIRQAGTHPFELRVEFDMNLRHGETPPPGPGRSPQSYTTPEEHIRTVETTLPRGLIGNPEAVPKCEAKDFAVGGVLNNWTSCPPNTQVGYIDLQLSTGIFEHGFGFFGYNPGFSIHVPVYNLEPPKGFAADFGFHTTVVDGHIYPSLDAADGYSIKASVFNISDLAPVRFAKFTMWGVPGDPAHDQYRLTGTEEGTMGEQFSGPVRPLLTLSSDCTTETHFRQRADSWTRPGVFTPTAIAEPAMMPTGCDDPRIRFEPSVALEPSSKSAGGPTGLQVNLEVPQRDQTVTVGNAWKLYGNSGDIHGVDTPPLKKAVVTMPEGMTISTSAAQGLGSCSSAQLALGTNDPVTCPENSQYGTLTLRTPILPKDAPMQGKIYVAKQNDNPFNSFLALYLVVQDPDRGLLVKIPGKVDLDPVTGQITTTFDDLPQFPVSDMQLTLKGGNRAALVNPSTCGQKTITATFYSWHDPQTPITRSSSYAIERKPDGFPCVNSLGERQFKPDLTAGTVSSSAGSFSPFAFRITRSDDDQEFSQLNVDLPKGLLAKIAGVSKCSDAAIRSAEASGRSGAEEQSSPSCPASSQIGSSDVGSGVGQVLTYIPGKTYLAGPYKGAPLSMVVITPIVTGPYDLGVIAVRSKIDVDPVLAKASVTTDPFPQIFKGIPVRIRDVRVNVDRKNTIVNPTNCEPMQIGSRVTGTGGDVNTTADDTAANLSERFQASDCASLPFKPQLAFKLKGGTNRGDYPAFTATLKARPGDANIARTAVTLPHSAFLAQEHIRTVCTRVQFAAKACPEASVYGYAKATSPLFDGTLEGPVYLRSSSNPLPDLVATLNGEINVVLAGRIDSIKEQIRNTFDVVPDAPVSTFTLSMQGGKKGLLVNSRNLCKGPARADVKMLGQNGKAYNSKPLVTNSCKKKAKKKKSKGKAKTKAKR